MFSMQCLFHASAACIIQTQSLGIADLEDVRASPSSRGGMSYKVISECKNAKKA